MPPPPDPEPQGPPAGRRNARVLAWTEYIRDHTRRWGAEATVDDVRGLYLEHLEYPEYQGIITEALSEFSQTSQAHCRIALTGVDPGVMILTLQRGENIRAHQEAAQDDLRDDEPEVGSFFDVEYTVKEGSRMVDPEGKRFVFRRGAWVREEEPRSVGQDRSLWDHLDED
jgi:hypothetical protein